MAMEQAVAGAWVAVVATATLLVAGRRLAERLGFVDVPHGHKTHSRPVPLTGGIAILGGVLASLVVLWADGWRGPDGLPVFVTLAAVLVLAGAVDDRIHLPVWVRFLIHGLVGFVMAVVAGVEVEDLGRPFGDEYVLALGGLSVPFTVFAVVGGINAMNMADGMDGFAGCLALISLLALAAVAWLGGEVTELPLLGAMIGAVTAFLAFNMRLFGRSRALAFLGDAGSTLLGFVIAWFLILLSQGLDRAMPPVLALWLFAVPVIDTVAVMLHRVMKGESPFRPGHDHLHHLLLGSGATTNRALVSGMTLHAGIVGLGLTLWWLSVSEALLYIAYAGVVMGYLRLRRRLVARAGAGRVPGEREVEGGAEELGL